MFRSPRAKIAPDLMIFDCLRHQVWHGEIKVALDNANKKSAEALNLISGGKWPPKENLHR